jgi:dienelactone hydrolase
MEPARAAAAHVSTTIKVGNNTAIYRAGPATARVGLLAFPDIFGLDSGRAKQDADALGALGYAVAFVDLADGEYMYDGWDMAAWKLKQDYASVLLPRIHDAITHLKEDAKVETIACYGYCWGAWVGARLSAEEGPLVKGHVSFHPSWRAETSLEGDDGIPKLAKRIKVPQLLLSAENEIEEVREGGCVQTILREREDARIATLSQVVDFPDVKHGWVNRGDLSDAKTKQSVDKAWALARAFLQQVTATA